MTPERSLGYQRMPEYKRTEPCGACVARGYVKTPTTSVSQGYDGACTRCGGWGVVQVTTILAGHATMEQAYG